MCLQLLSTMKSWKKFREYTNAQSKLLCGVEYLFTSTLHTITRNIIRSHQYEVLSVEPKNFTLTPYYDKRTIHRISTDTIHSKIYNTIHFFYPRRKANRRFSWDTTQNFITKMVSKVLWNEPFFCHFAIVILWTVVSKKPSIFQLFFGHSHYDFRKLQPLEITLYYFVWIISENTASLHNHIRNFWILISRRDINI